eukprot:235081-Rhodomonas_salina.1
MKVQNDALVQTAADNAETIKRTEQSRNISDKIKEASAETMKLIQQNNKWTEERAQKAEEKAQKAEERARNAEALQHVAETNLLERSAELTAARNMAADLQAQLKHKPRGEILEMAKAFPNYLNAQTIHITTMQARM